jgi:hypothetical protein
MKLEKFKQITNIINLYFMVYLTKAQHQVKAAARTLADNTRVSEPLALNALLG